MLARLALASLFVFAAPAAALETVQEIQDCMDKNFPQRSSVQTIVMNAHDRIGAVTTLRAKIYWAKGEEDLSKVVMRISDPPDMRGSAILILEKKPKPDMFMYLPELQQAPGSGGRVRRITGHMMSGSMFGTDFSYEEFERLQGVEGDDFKSERLPDAEVEGRPAYVVQTTYTGVPGEKPTNDRTVIWVDRERCLPMQMEFYERGTQLRKRLVVDPARIEAQGTRHVARRMEIKDVKDGTHTEMLVEDIEMEADIPQSTFTTRWLETQGAKSF
jgi:hypothetical protein